MPGSTTLAPTTMTLPSLLVRATRVVSSSWQSPARMPSSLLHATTSPIPLPPTTTARSASPDCTSRQTSSHSGG